MIIKHLTEQIRLGRITYEEVIEKRPELEEKLIENMIKEGLSKLIKK